MSDALQGDEGLNRRFNAVKNTSGMLRQVQLRAVAEAKRLVHRKTGHTARTIQAGGYTDSYAIISAGGAAPFLELGTKAHVIVPKRARVLAWPASSSGRRLSGRARTSAGRMVFAGKANHPGTKPYPFLVPGAKKALDEVGIEAIVTLWNKAD